MCNRGRQQPPPPSGGGAATHTGAERERDRDRERETERDREPAVGVSDRRSVRLSGGRCDYPASITVFWRTLFLSDGFRHFSGDGGSPTNQLFRRQQVVAGFSDDGGGSESNLFSGARVLISASNCRSKLVTVNSSGLSQNWSTAVQVRDCYSVRM
ncbi:hypothetical protein HanRHA438_Chr06g0280271 [Helianthus annuus]|uniref:Uncharacterized protein n=1 Tax=Helianthus annuus TaxID=4232 RepID=A0A251UA59_HELAN|nr:uncharacterized protein LOC110867958 [Helianthus annuus]KAF5803427.1 hypothetical protein HanXRQr2_Chr06g0271201 [Helianthus annuus]KAJ0561385.1 hypothetical protein HanHA300_Chr06g0222311 [Helianthus annuus]KAJ0568005.1 hypothetical protein HanIR_Chr06g0291251 [Helianthus annuus]KAJ0574438.1 hypothetical protein HanHA89_Chr06g0238151 [Helianthus annuus]KAJ0738774.1 hypothetical protein HanLR1_Chr06g0222101 [Helianthus annuus]